MVLLMCEIVLGSDPNSVTFSTCDIPSVFCLCFHGCTLGIHLVYGAGMTSFLLPQRTWFQGRAVNVAETLLIWSINVRDKPKTSNPYIAGKCQLVL